MRNSQQGFTLLELLIAMAIFAVLAVAGWQVFDGLNRAKERAQYHADQLSALQYAYLQIQQDMGQIVAYQDPDSIVVTTDNMPPASSQSTAQDKPSSVSEIESTPIFTLNQNEISFVRFADPDPRYQSSPALIRVVYVFEGEALIRKQFTDMTQGKQAISLDSVLIEDIQNGHWQAFTPEASNSFPNKGDTSINRSMSQSEVNRTDKNEEDSVKLLPKGIGLSFSYHETPLLWKFALSSPPPK